MSSVIDIEKILIDLGISYKNAGPNNFRIKCINPDHDETVPSMSVHKELGLINCFGCFFSGSILTLLNHFDIYGGAAIQYLQKFTYGGNTAEEIKEELDTFIYNRKTSEKENLIKYVNIELPMHKLIESNIYLERRGITPQEMKEWNMAIVTQGRNTGWILIPIYQNGILRNYFMRSSFGIGKLYGEYPRHDIIAGIDNCPDTNKPIYLTEGIFDAITIKRFGVQAAACLSNHLLPAQLQCLKKYKEIIFVPDTDDRGIDLVLSAGELIYNCNVHVCVLPKYRKDANECTKDELYKALQYKIPWNLYIIENIEKIIKRGKSNGIKKNKVF